MSDLDRYLHAATRDNTRRSYRAAIEHFEVEWGGSLPATAESVARYLAAHAGQLSLNTLKLRLSALAQWHNSQGFPDPTKAPLVRQTLRGIRALHPAREKQAEPLQLRNLQQVVETPARAKRQAEAAGHRRLALLRSRRDAALILLGFWRGFRSDELVPPAGAGHPREPGVEHEPVPAAQQGRPRQPRHPLPGTGAAAVLVQAYPEWIASAGLLEGGGVSRRRPLGANWARPGLHANSVIPLLRQALAAPASTPKATAATRCAAASPPGPAPAAGTSRR